MKKTLRTIQADQVDHYRPMLVSEYCERLHYMSSNQKAKILVSHARSQGLCDWKYMAGSLLEQMAGERGVSKWIVESILQILLKKNWQPQTDEVWAVFMKTWLYEHGPFSHVGEVLDSLPAHFNKLKALEWAIFFESRLQLTKETHVIWRVEDTKGNKVVHDSISLSLARDVLADRFPQVDRMNPEQNGFKLTRHYIFLKDIDLHDDIPDSQLAVLRRRRDALEQAEATNLCVHP